MAKVELTPAFLDRLRGLAQNCQPPIWEVNEHSDVVSVAHTVAECGYDEDAQFIAEANPATVLAMVEEIERFRHFVRETLDELHECYNEESCKICKEIDRVIESEAGQ